MERIQLINAVSKDILENNKDNYISSVMNKVLEYDKLFDEVLRNYYELKMDDEIPLFTLCEYYELGKENYGMSLQEYLDKLVYLLKKVNKTFNTNYVFEKED